MNEQVNETNGTKKIFQVEAHLKWKQLKFIQEPLGGVLRKSVSSYNPNVKHFICAKSGY